MGRRPHLRSIKRNLTLVFHRKDAKTQGHPVH